MIVGDALELHLAGAEANSLVVDVPRILDVEHLARDEAREEGEPRREDPEAVRAVGDVEDDPVVARGDAHPLRDPPARLRAPLEALALVAVQERVRALLP